MTLVLIYNDRTEVIEFTAASDEYCCIFDEICGIIMNTFDLSNLLCDYHMAFHDVAYGVWINFNVHVTKRITELLRDSVLKKLKIRIERLQRNAIPSFNKVESRATENRGKLFSLIINVTEYKINIPSAHCSKN